MTSQVSAQSSSSNRKRLADADDLLSEQRLSKRLHLLELGQAPRATNGSPTISVDSATVSPKVPSTKDYMLVDDTAHKVFIADLDAELRTIREDDEKLRLLPELEEKLSKIPPQLLAGRTHPVENNMQLILYKTPRTISVPPLHDSVKRALIDNRKQMNVANSSATQDRDLTDAMEIG